MKLPRFRRHRNVSFKESAMAKTRLPYAPEFRRQMVELVNAGRSPEELAREFEPTAQSIKDWVAQAARNTGHGDGGLTTTEREELSRIRRENRQLKREREILSGGGLVRSGENRECAMILRNLAVVFGLCGCNVLGFL